MWNESIKKAFIEEAVRLINNFAEIGFQAFIDGGTLLGAVRDGKIIPYDKDMDIFYLSKQNNLRDALSEFYTIIKPKLEERNYHIRNISNWYQGKVREMLGQFYIETNRNTYYTNLPNVWFDLWLSWFDKEGKYNLVFLIANDKDIKYQDIMPARLIKLENRNFTVPNNYNKLLTKLYGDWKTPRQEKTKWNNYYSRKKILLIMDEVLIPNKIIETIDFHDLSFASITQTIKNLDNMDIDEIYIPIIENKIDMINEIIKKAEKRNIKIKFGGIK